ncbi:50S ribosomal protein L11 methyltransferase [Bacillus sp. V5-8f]|uniref:50S ribosomal protein L11 methyltransferase n=1 Tax=Bacillus sp. V5-8f TaxID=2053044 RepID=UPI0015E1421F|nr:50S ribosomal protein L11 methyltransferase [Bacillus sp. V5-8f]
MLHEFTISFLHKHVDEMIEKLNLHGYYNLYYDQPIEQFTEENGYGFQEVLDADIDLKIILEETAQSPVNVEQAREQIASVLNVDRETIHYEPIEIQDWQQPFPIIDLQNGWKIRPTHSEEEVGGRVIHFEPPRAFGSGLHETTQDCLRFILREDLRGKTVLDVGSGAGLLSISASLAGAEKVVAIDMEDVEAEVLYNAGLNGVEKRISIQQVDVLDPTIKVDGLFDWICVNIAAKEIKELYPFLDSHLVSNGHLLLSGMLDWNFKDALDLYKNYHVDQISYSDEWVTALLRKK